VILTKISSLFRSFLLGHILLSGSDGKIIDERKNLASS
jgi:hypothetical protein